MKRANIVGVLFIMLFALAGCEPDLVVKELDVTWDGTNKKAKAKIANIGNKDAGEFMVYFDGLKDPVSTDYRPQVIKNVPGLAKGASITLEADFSSKPPLEINNVIKIQVIADPKDMVQESNEDNNEKVKSVF